MRFQTNGFPSAQIILQVKAVSLFFKQPIAEVIAGRLNRGGLARRFLTVAVVEWGCWCVQFEPLRPAARRTYILLRWQPGLAPRPWSGLYEPPWCLGGVYSSGSTCRLALSPSLYVRWQRGGSPILQFLLLFQSIMGLASYLQLCKQFCFVRYLRELSDCELLFLQLYSSLPHLSILASQTLLSIVASEEGFVVALLFTASS